MKQDLRVSQHSNEDSVMHTMSKRIIFHVTHLQPKRWVTTIRELLLTMLTLGILGVMFLWAMQKYLICIFGKLCP